MKLSFKKILLAVVLLSGFGGAPAHADKIWKYPGAAYVFDSHKLIYTDENASGYRRLTATEPASGDQMPLSNITTYPDSDESLGFGVSWSTYEGPEINGKESTVMVHTTIPLAP